MEEAGHPAWAVGGALRDTILGLPRSDWDLATRARPKEVRRLFRRTIPVGIEHGTVGVVGDDRVMYEVTTFRRDVETFGRHAVVEFADRIDEDLSRRDFTFNAIAWRPATDEVRDPFNGEADLKRRVLRTVGDPAERFAEDYLRILRGLRFAGQFDLTIDTATWAAMVAARDNVTALSAERVREELWKVLSKARRPSRALELYESAGVLQILYPELAALAALDESDEARVPWRHTLAAVDALPPIRPLLRLAVLFHAVGMPAARSRDLRGGWRYTGHEVFGARIAEEMMRRLKASNAQIERVRRLVAHQADLFPPDAPDAGVRRWLRFVGADLVNDLFRLRIALWRAMGPDGVAPSDVRERWSHARRVLRGDAPLSLGDLAVDGRDLIAAGVPAGPSIGDTLRRLLERVTDEPELNERETLLRIAREETVG